MNKKDLNNRLERIANVLLLNASFTDNLGMLNGKMGIAIFFYKYGRYTKNDLYNRYAGELIDEIFEEISTNTSNDFENGLTGIGWGFEYLIQNGFVEADSDEILVEIDDALFNTTISSFVTLLDQDSLFGLGLYYLARIYRSTNDGSKYITPRKRMYLNNFLDECEGLLTKEAFVDVCKRKFNLYQLNSFIWFILQMKKNSFISKKNNKFSTFLIELTNYKTNKVSDNIDIVLFQNIIEELSLLTESNAINLLITKKNVHYLKLETIPSNEEMLVSQYIKSGWMPMIYEEDYVYFDPNLKSETLKIIDSNENWEQRIDTLNKYNMGLNNGMAGLGITLLNETKRMN